jgi:hypothetical protein
VSERNITTTNWKVSVLPPQPNGTIRNLEVNGCPLFRECVKTKFNSDNV